MVELKKRKMKVSLINKISPSAFNHLTNNHPLQTWEWGEFKRSEGIAVERFGVWEKGKLISVFQIFFHPLPKTNFTVGYFPRGEEPKKLIIRAIEKAARKNKAILVKLEPNQVYKTWINEKGKIKSEEFKENKFDFRKLGLVKSSKTTFDPHTFILDLKKDQNELLGNLHYKTRYNLRLAQKKGVEVVQDNTPAGLTIFTSLLFEETVKRQGFYLHDPRYFRELWDKLFPAGIAKILLAKYKGHILAAWMLFFWKKTLYYPYGASSSQFRNLMASNLICWEAIKIGQKLGAEKFDLWGGLSPNASSAHPWYGFHRFKLGYGGNLVEMVGSWDLVINQPLYHLYNLTEKLRWKILRLKKR